MGIGSLLPISGCASDGLDSRDEPSAEGNRDADVRLAALYASNSHSEPHAVDIELKYDDATVLEDTVELEAASENETSSIPIENDWPDTAGVFVVRARVDGSDWKRQNLAKRYGKGTDCVRSMVKVMPDGSFGIWANENCPN